MQSDTCETYKKAFHERYFILLGRNCVGLINLNLFVEFSDHLGSMGSYYQVLRGLLFCFVLHFIRAVGCDRETTLPAQQSEEM